VCDSIRRSRRKIAREPRTLLGGEEDPMKCPACGSSRVERRPPDQISPHPGYQCRNCGTVMRAREMLVVYLVVLMIGFVFLGGFVFLMVSDVTGPGVYLPSLPAVVCTVYAIRQLLRPVPLRDEPEEDEHDDDKEDDEDEEDRPRRRGRDEDDDRPRRGRDGRDWRGPDRW
jgi:hypothetical protein